MRKYRSKSVVTVLLPLSLAGFLAACESEEHATLADCERVNGPGQCAAAPQAVLMTEKNRPSYGSKDACEQDFGEEKCEERRQGPWRSYHPLFYPNQTHFYPYGTPGYVGYYGRSPLAQPPAGPSKFVSMSRIKTPTASRGGFGAKPSVGSAPRVSGGARFGGGG